MSSAIRLLDRVRTIDGRIVGVLVAIFDGDPQDHRPAVGVIARDGAPRYTARLSEIERVSLGKAGA